MKLKDTPIQTKLMSVILLSCAVVVLLMCTAYIIFEYFTFKQTLKAQVSTLATVIASNSSASLAFDYPKDANETLLALGAEKRIVAACLYDINGALFAKYPPDVADAKFPVKPAAEGFFFRNGYMEGFKPVLQKKDQVGTLYIKSDMEAMYTQLKKYGVIAILLFCFSLLVAFLLSRVLQKSISQPILALEQTAKIISQKRDYSVRAVKSGKDEVGALTDAFNDMLTRIEVQNSEITSFNLKLEQKVRERTNELESANNYLKQQNDFVETIIDASVHIIVVLDVNLRFSTLNKRCEEIYGMDKKDILGKSYLELFPQAADSPAYHDILKALDGNYIHNTVTRSVIAKGYFENYFIPLRQGDEVYGVLILSHDITDIMEANERLKEVNNELEKSNRDLEQFAFIASHDLQEPLRKIHIFNDLMGENFHDEKTMRKYQEKINQSAVRMQDLIMDVLNFSRISKVEEAFIKTDLNKTLETLKNDFEVLIVEKGAVITYPTLPVVYGIPLQMSQLFSNLISNSLKYSDKRPVINISSHIMSPEEVSEHKRLHTSASYILIKFSDNGIGFEPKYSEQIFTIFQRLHGKHAYSGTGIGLALCRKIVENHQGIITAESEPGKGAVFNIILPAAPFAASLS